jgi:hypothetical protein
VDVAARPEDKGRWTLGYRAKFLKEERVPGDRPRENCPSLTDTEVVDETVPRSGPTVGLSIYKDSEGVWVFCLAGEETTRSDEVVLFRYLKILCDNPGKEFSPTELRDAVDPERTRPMSQSDTRTVRKAWERIGHLPRPIQAHCAQHVYRGTTYRYEEQALT